MMMLLAIAILVMKRTVTRPSSWALLHEPLDLVAIRLCSEVNALLAEIHGQALFKVHEPHVILGSFAEVYNIKLESQLLEHYKTHLPSFSRMPELHIQLVSPSPRS